jgi:hypothetical protein
MQKELDTNAHKGDWHEFLDEIKILHEVEWHKAKLLFAMRDNNLEKMKEHSADCANFFMMLLNANGCLTN